MPNHGSIHGDPLLLGHGSIHGAAVLCVLLTFSSLQHQQSNVILSLQLLCLISENTHGCNVGSASLRSVLEFWRYSGVLMYGVCGGIPSGWFLAFELTGFDVHQHYL